MKQAIFPLTADPLTYGHLDIIEKAFRLCERELIIALLKNNTKQSFFSAKKRKELVAASIGEHAALKLQIDKEAQSKKSGEFVLKNKDNKCMRILNFDGLLSDLVLREDTFTIIRGLRKSEDMVYEKLLEKGWREQLAAIDEKLNIIYLISDEPKRNISSSIARAIAAHHGDLSSYVPAIIKKAIDQKLFNQQKVIVTGSIATGKTSIAHRLKAIFNSKEREAYVVRFDDIVNEIYNSMNEGHYGILREKIIKHFGPSIVESGKISKKRISQLTFSKELPEMKENLLFLEKNFSPYILKAYRRELLGKSGTFFLDASQAAEYDMLYESIGLVVYVENNEEIQKRNIKNRNRELGKTMDLAEMEKRIKASLPQQEKRALIEKRLRKLGCGKLLVYA